MVFTSAHDAFYSGLATLTTFVPRLIGALLVLVIGWFVAGLVGKLVRGVIDRLGADRLTRQAGVDAFFQRAGVRDFTAGALLGALATWWIRLIVLEVAADALGVAAVTKTLDTLVAYLPNVFAAIVLILIGAYVARLARSAAQATGFGNASMLGVAAQATVLVLFFVAALDQIHVAEALVNELTIAALATIAGSSILAFGLGGRDVAAHLLGAAYVKGREASSKARGPGAAPGPPVHPGGGPGTNDPPRPVRQ